MPEGDTIHRTAATLRQVLVGRQVTSIEAPRVAASLPEPGTRVVSVEARGKHLLVGFSDGRFLHTHLGMPGSWHVYPPGRRWQRRDVRALVAVPGQVAVCFGAPVVEVLDGPALERHPALQRLGPDLCRPDADLGEGVARMASVPDPATPIGDVLLDQRVAAGIGNVYRSEVCFLEGVDPHRTLSSVPATTRRDLLARAARLLRHNLTTTRRTTVTGAPPGTLYVYGRDGRPCRTCGTAVEVARSGEHARIVYWCPRCQS